MTCFWVGLLSILTKNDLNNTLKRHISLGKPRPTEFVKLLKKHAIETHHVLWNGQKLRSQELKENLERINEFDVTKINDGYDCSSCDPYLLLICELFAVHIHHNFNGSMIKYTHIRPANTTRILKVSSNRGHFRAG